MSDSARMTEQSARRYCSYCSTDVIATRKVPADTTVDPFVVLGTLGLALLFRKSGLDTQLEPFRCPACGNPVAARAVGAARRKAEGRQRPETDDAPRAAEKTPGEAASATPVKSAREYAEALAKLGEHSRGAYREYNKSVRYGILLYYGPMVTAQVDKLVAAGNVERARKLLKAARPYRWPRAQRLAKFLALPVLMDLVAFGFVVVGAVQLAETSASSEWPTAEATVLRSGVDTVHTDDGTSYRAVVSYRYQVDGVSYLGDRVSFDWSTSDLDDAREVAGRYVPGAFTQAYYKRGNPARSVLIPGPSMTAAVFVAAGVFMMIGSAVAIAVLMRKPLKELRELEGHAREG